MAIASTDIIYFGSASMPDDDTPTDIGGAIDTTKRVVFEDIAPNGQVEALSDSGSDTSQQMTVTGRNTAGEIISDTQTLTGTTPAVFTPTFERILKVVMDSAAVGNVTLREFGPGDDLMIFRPNELQFRRPFYNAAADPSTGSTKKYYDKIFIKNEHGTLSLTEAKVVETSDPSGKIAFALETTLDGSGTNGTGNNRLVAPTAGVSAFDSTTKNVANSGNLTAGSAQGVWLELTLSAGDAADDTTYTPSMQGQTVA